MHTITSVTTCIHLNNNKLDDAALVPWRPNSLQKYINNLF